MANLSRLFVAADLTVDARHRLAHVLAEWAPQGLPGRVVPPHNWHLTIRFIGDADEVSRDRLIAGLDTSLAFGPVAIELSTLGSFPRSSRAEVLWVGVSRGAERLADLAAIVEEVVRRAGFSPEERPFSPHLTLSRIRPPEDLRPLLAHPPVERVSFDLTDLTLYRSHLGSGGARYEPIEVFPLR